mgnify:FL=1
MVSPSARKAAVKELVEGREYSERRGCVLVGVSRTAYRRKPVEREDEAALRKRIKELAAKRKRYGCPRIAALLRREGWRVNKKRVHRIWKEEGLSLLRRRPKRKRRGRTVEIVNRATHKNHVWSYDFIEDTTESGDKLRMLDVVDEYTRECHQIHVGRSVSAEKVVDILSWLFLMKGAPEHIRSDNGPEFVAKAVCDWLDKSGCKTIFIEPGSPWENPYIESFNGRFRDECLNREIFRNAREAQEIVENWRREYNELRPHSSLGYRTPAEFAAMCGEKNLLHHPDPFGRPPVSLRDQGDDLVNIAVPTVREITSEEKDKEKEKILTF